MGFQTGKTLVIIGVKDLIYKGVVNEGDVIQMLHRHCSGDWSEMDEMDQQSNKEAVESGEDRVFSFYKVKDVDFYINTEWDRSYTTVLLPSEY